MAPSTPPPPSSERFAAFTIASTSRVVMSATTMSSMVWPISAESVVMRASLSRAASSGRDFKFQGGTHADVVIMRVEKAARGPAAVGAQNLEEVIVSVKPARRVQRLRRSCESDAMKIDPAILSGASPARQLAFVDQLADESKATQLRHQR